MLCAGVVDHVYVYGVCPVGFAVALPTPLLHKSGLEDAVTFKYQMAHLYHHVNSAWNTRRIRSLDDPILHEKFLEYAEHPTDLTAWGD